jgi:hypothetical protein
MFRFPNTLSKGRYSIVDYALNSTEHFSRVALELFGAEGTFEIELDGDRMMDEAIVSFLQLGCSIERLRTKDRLKVTPPAVDLLFPHATAKLRQYRVRLTSPSSPTFFSPGAGRDTNLEGGSDALASCATCS